MPDDSLRSEARLPTELCYHIIDFLAYDVISIRHCCIVSKAWLAQAQIWLYHTIQVLDDSVGSFEYIREYAPYVTMRMRTFRRFLASGTPLLSYVQRLRIGCFWHDDEESWSEYVADWVCMPALETLTVDQLQVYVHSDQNIGPLLSVLALRLPEITDLSFCGRFAESPDMASSIAAFRKLDSLQFEWRGWLNPDLRAVLTYDSSPWQAPPISTGVVGANCGSLPLMLAWFRERASANVDFMLTYVYPNELVHGTLVESLDSCIDDARRCVIGLDVNALDEPLLPEACREFGSLVKLLPRLQLLIVTVAYSRDSPLMSVPTHGGRRLYDYDPIWVLAHMFGDDFDPRRDCLRAVGISLHLQIAASDLDLLWYHEWGALDWWTSNGFITLFVSLCVTQCAAPLNYADTFNQFVRRVMPRTAARRALFTTYVEVPVRKSYKPGAETGFVQFARSDFSCDTDINLPDDAESEGDVYLPSEPRFVLPPPQPRRRHSF